VSRLFFGVSHVESGVKEGCLRLRELNFKPKLGVDTLCEVELGVEARAIPVDGLNVPHKAGVIFLPRHFSA
jgi:hypothetical protein